MIRAKKSFGQHFLQDRSVIKKIIAAAEIVPGETILEIGPGQGVLTEALVEAGAQVIAVEADHDLIAGLEKRFGSRIHLIEGDILQVRQKALPGINSYKLVANLPYNITSLVLETFLREEPRPRRMVIMIQKEVADRMLAKPGEMGLLSVVCQLYADVKRVVSVPPGAFRPMPKVESTVVRLDMSFRTSKTSMTYDPEKIIALAKAGFSSRRKQLHRNLHEAKWATSEAIKTALQSLHLPKTARAQELSVDEWVQLYNRLK